jgi:zinc protease
VGSQFSSHPIDEVANFMAFAIYAPENADGVVEAFQEEMANALETGFTTEEVEAAINGYLEAEQNGRGSDNSLASQLAAGLFFNRTMEWTADLERRMSELTPEQINEAVKRHFDLSRVIIIRAGDFEGAKAAS